VAWLAGSGSLPGLRRTGRDEVLLMTATTIRLTTRRAAEFLGISEATLRWFRHKGDRGPRSYALTKRHVVYDLADLQEWAEGQKAATSKGGCPVTCADAVALDGVRRIRP
jgi:predicted DNA-binding transcriptional regulator AlpA